MKVVSDSSVLIALSSIGYLTLIKERFPKGIAIPQAVWREVVVDGGEKKGALSVAKSDWISVITVKDDRTVSLLQAELDLGEAEAIALAKELDADVVLIDERDARRAARRMNLRVLGTVGLLMWAKKAGRITSISTVLDLLCTDGKFRLSSDLCERAIRESGENEKVGK